MSSPTQLRLPDAHGYLDRVIGELRALNAPHKHTLISVLEYLSDHIRVTRMEISALGTGNKEESISSTADELEAVVTETARAANRIMDAAEKIEKVAVALSGSDASVSLMQAATDIYEASAFQDITGQRISKIVSAIQSLELKLGSLMSAFGPLHDRPRSSGRNGDAALLNGPQLENNAASQTDIDALFASLE